MADNEEQIEFSVYVHSEENDEPYRNAEVRVYFGNWSSWLDEYTDESGHAYFSAPPTLLGGNWTITIYINGPAEIKDIGQYELHDGDSFTAYY
jgi:hypothetical protein